MQRVFEKIKECLDNLGWVFADYYPDGTELHKERKKSVRYDEVVEIVNQVASEYGEEVCEWFKYDYRTIAPRNHDVENPYWRIPEDMSKLKYCPYCGKKIKVVE